MTSVGLDGGSCMLCLQDSCDIRLSCGCTLHSTCLPIDIILHNTQPFCPYCHVATIELISLLPLPADELEEVYQFRAEHNPYSIPPLPYAKKKRGSTSQALTLNPSCRTGSWSIEESSLVENLVRSFDAGLLPLPRGTKLNDFLSDLLSCKISRVTKKFKYEKFSTRSYGIRGSTSGGLISFQAGVGASIQKAQVLFLGTLSPVWKKTEMRLNMSRVWREQFRKLCSQVQCSLLDTTAWDISIKNIGSLHLEDSLEAKRKRLKQALHEDVLAAAKFGNDVANDLSQELLSTLMDETHEANTSVSVVNQLRSLESITGGLEGSNTKFKDTEPGMHHRISSFGSLDDIIAGPNYSSMQSKAGSGLFDGLFDDDAQDSMEWNGVLCQEIPQDSKPSSTGWNGVLCQEIPQDSKPSSTEWTGVLRQGIPQDSKPRSEQVNRVIDSVVKNAFKEGEQNDRFLMKISSFVTSTDLNFQHCDVWAPTQSGEMCGQVRLVNVGHISFDKIPSHAAKKLNEFGVYSKTFSFAPGSGLPGRVFGSGRCIWINDVHQATTEEFGLAGGAMMCGVRTAVGFHVSAFNCTLVVILYSTADLVRDFTVESLCINFFRHMNPTLKWHLSIDVANDETEGIIPSSPETTCHE